MTHLRVPRRGSIKRPRSIAAVVAIVAVAAVTVVALAVALGDEGSQVADTGGATAATATADSADRLIFWTGCEGVAALSDPELDAWHARGVDGFVCMVGHLPGMGGSQDFTGDLQADLSGDSYSLQRSLRDSRIVERADDRGMKLYLGAYLANYHNTATPLHDWFDDAGWAQRVLPKLRELAGAARALGFTGVALDQELYPQAGGAETATWAWDYPGNNRTEQEVRAKAEQRGGEVMHTLLEAFPGLEVAVYHFAFPGAWSDLVQEEVNGVEDAAADLLHGDFWDGMTSAEGYTAIRFWDNIFYKASHRGSWDTALTYNQNRVFAFFSRHLSNWDYASERVSLSPFSWINPGPNEDSAFDDARPPDYVEEQLLAFRKWGMGGEFANFSYGSLDGFDYSPYTSAMQAASSAAEVDGQAPEVTLTSAADGSSPGAVSGTARDDLAIKAVRWRDDRGGSGTAELSWEILSGGYRSGYDWEMRWSFPTSEITPGAAEVEITAEDIKGNTSAPAVHPLP